MGVALLIPTAGVSVGATPKRAVCAPATEGAAGFSDAVGEELVVVRASLGVWFWCLPAT